MPAARAAPVEELGVGEQPARRVPLEVAVVLGTVARLVAAVGEGREVTADVVEQVAEAGQEETPGEPLVGPPAATAAASLGQSVTNATVRQVGSQSVSGASPTARSSPHFAH